MPDFRITVTETFGAPEGTTLLDDARGLLLPTGEIIKPWIVLELNEDRDLSGADMDRLGLDVGLDFARIVEPLADI
ncbi:MULTISPECIES: hypothetical protein [unclassified Sphingomonas]|uniref:hypothetical protein n=1 Tax=unclassified Sphingomonas TaxID=196159 RepID=UPI00092861A9|nr:MULTISPECIES: hypothetical protein [unclassified Sphingomonas]MBN8847365.1 hypothetical protein [Sphingomonas sp.]OJV28228.1 MAG: hypothetical protein BGO24_07810 [Sphingomonas sp. 67-36]